MRLLAATVVATTLLVAPAAARRHPGPREHRAIAEAVDQPVRCVTARVSTVNERWAAVSIKVRSGCQVGDGYLYVKRQAHRQVWKVVGSGPHIIEPYRCPRPFPKKVAKDLRLCR